MLIVIFNVSRICRLSSKLVLLKINGLSNQTTAFIFLRYRLINLLVGIVLYVFRACTGTGGSCTRIANCGTIQRNCWYAWHMRLHCNPRCHATAERRRFIRKQRQSARTLTDLRIADI